MLKEEAQDKLLYTTAGMLENQRGTKHLDEAGAGTSIVPSYYGRQCHKMILATEHQYLSRLKDNESTGLKLFRQRYRDTVYCILSGPKVFQCLLA